MRWHNVWWLAKKELMRTGWGYVWNVAFAAYFALVAGGILIDRSPGTDRSEFLRYHYFIDLMFLIALGVLGFTVTRENFRYWRNKGISIRLRFLRSLPISMEEIVVGRIITFLGTMLVSSVCFFAILYVIQSPLFEQLAGLEYAEFALVWVGYGMLAGAYYMIWELGSTERVYFIVCMATSLVYIALPLLSFLIDVHFVAGSIELVRKFGIAAPLLSLAVGALALYGASRICVKRVAKRPLHS